MKMTIPKSKMKELRRKSLFTPWGGSKEMYLVHTQIIASLIFIEC